MKRLVILISAGILLTGGAFWYLSHHSSEGKAESAGEAKPSEEEASGPKVTHDANGNAVIAVSDELQGNMGIQVTNPAPLQLSPELKLYGRVLDPTPLVSLLTELASSQAAYVASSNELARLKTLSGQGNASARALQAAEATALHDQLAVRAAEDKLRLGWGAAFVDQPDVSGFIQSLTVLETALVRVDLMPDQIVISPGQARVQTLTDQSAEALFLSFFPAVDPSMQGRGLLYEIKANPQRLSPGQAVTAYIRLPGEPLHGVVIPREAVVRTEGASWVYVLDPNSGESFVRTEVDLDRPTEAGYFISKGVTAGEHVVVRGAQQLLSIELKPQGGD